MQIMSVMLTGYSHITNESTTKKKNTDIMLTMQK